MALCHGLAWAAVTHPASWGSRCCHCNQRCHGNRLNQSQIPVGAENKPPAARELGLLWWCSGFRRQIGERSPSCAGHGAGWRARSGSAAKKLVQRLEHVTRGGLPRAPHPCCLCLMTAAGGEWGMGDRGPLGTGGTSSHRSCSEICAMSAPIRGVGVGGRRDANLTDS